MKYVLFLIFLASCASKLNVNSEKNNSFKFQLPSSVVAIGEIKDKESIEYTIAAYKAISDIINLGKSSLSTANSGLALQYFSIGNNLFPYRNDILKMKEIALSRYIKSTNDLIEKKDIACNIVKERVIFLEDLAPDAIAKITQKKENCPLYLDKSKTFNLGRVINLKTPPPSSGEDKYNIDLSKEYDYTIWKNGFFPISDLTALYVQYLGGFKITPIKINRFDIHEKGISISANYKLSANRQNLDYENLEEEIKKTLQLPLDEKGYLPPKNGFGRKRMDLGEMGFPSAGPQAREFLRDIFCKPKMIVDLVLNYNDGREVISKFIIEYPELDCRGVYTNSLYDVNSFLENGDSEDIQNREIRGFSYNKNRDCGPVRGVCLHISPKNKTMEMDYLPESLMKDLKGFEINLNLQDTFKYYTNRKYQGNFL